MLQSGAKLSEPPAPPGRLASLLARLGRLVSAIRDYFVHTDPGFVEAFVPALLLSTLVFVRSPLSNYIFDEQEALLANPFVNGEGIPFWQAFKRDFWGLLPERSIGSYRPLPNLIWRAVWWVSHRPFFHHWVNLIIHASNAALLARFAFRLTQNRIQGWLAGGCFLLCAVLTEAVTGVVGLSDVLAGLATLLALGALELNAALLPLALGLALLLGLFSKESVIVILPLVAWVALVTAPLLHPQKPLRVLRGALALLGAAVALFVYTETRRRLFPVSVPLSRPSWFSEPRGAWLELFDGFLNWFRQPSLPHDPINNPLVTADTSHRIAGALRVYSSGLGQILLPSRLSADYSFAAEPVPTRLLFPGSVLGGLALLFPPLLGLICWFASLRARAGLQRRRILCLLAITLVWVPLSYFPHSNILVLLPTVRAERFWYLPAIGTSLLLALPLSRLLRTPHQLGACVVMVFFGFQALQARRHAFDYTDDLVFWRATRNAVPESAKAHLNYSVMLGARGKLDERLVVNQTALKLAPNWPMAHVYYGDTLCRLHRAEEAWPHYRRGFEMAPNDLNLIALGLQCLWEEKTISGHSAELLGFGQSYPGTWLSYLSLDVVQNGSEQNGVDKKYRPRGYDEGPKRENR